MFKRYVYIEGLTNLLGSDGKYLINIDSQVKDVKGNDIPFYRDENGHKVVRCQGWDGERDYRVIDLMVIQFKGLRIPSKFFDRIIGFCIDGDFNNTHARNIGYRFAHGKLEVEGSPGFFYVPGLPNAAINGGGELINLNAFNKRKWSIAPPVAKGNIKGGYRTTGILFYRKKMVSITRHRCLCLVFKEFPDNVDVLVVNHKDGIPGNDWLSNLEWATRSENNTHAYVNDLKNQHKRVLVRNAKTKEVTEYYSISECSRRLGFSSVETVWQRLNGPKFGKVFSDGFQVKLKSDPRDWIDHEDVEAEIRKAKLSQGVVVRNCKTLEEKLYSSITQAGTAILVNRATVTNRLNADNRTPIFGYQFKYSEDARQFPDFTEKEYEDSFRPLVFTVSARNLLSGDYKEFSSIRSAEIEFENSHIRFLLNKGEQPLLETGWQIKLSRDNWKEVNDFEEEIYKLQRTIVAKKEKDGGVVIADNAAMLASILGMDPKTIRKIAFTRGNKVYKGYRFRLGVSNEPWPDTKID